MTSSSLDYIGKDYFQLRPHSEVLGVRISAYVLGGGAVQFSAKQLNSPFKLLARGALIPLQCAISKPF